MRPSLLLAGLCALGLALLLLLPPPAKDAATPAPPVKDIIPAPTATSVTPESLASEIEAIRGLRFTKPLQFPRVPVVELEKKVRSAMSSVIPPNEVALRLRAAFALGLIRPGMEFDAADCLTGSAMEVPACHYDADTATMWVNESFSPETRPDLTLRLVFHLARALVLQQPGQSSPPLPSCNDDSLLTAIAMLHADATLTIRQHTMRFAGRIPSGVTVPETSTYHASPPFLRSLLAFPNAIANTFHTSLREKAPHADANAFLNELLSHPPHTTAELLHPTTYPAPPISALVINRNSLPPLPVLTENTLGEFGILTLFKTQLTNTESEPAAAGLITDRYLILSGSGPGQDHLLWRTRWSTSGDATAFLHALAATHLGNAGITPSANHFPTPDTFRATTSTLTLHTVTHPNHTITFAASPNPSIVQQLLAVP